MNSRPGFFSDRRHRGVAYALVLAASCGWSSAQAEAQDVVFPCSNVDTTYGVKPGQAITATDIETNGLGNDVYWTFINQGSSCSGTAPNFICAGLNVTVPPVDTAVTPGTLTGKVNVTGTGGPSGTPDGRFNLKVTDVVDTAQECIGKYRLHVAANGGGWGDPHLTTVDGVHYDFQSAGEFTALAEDGLEIQTRQSPVPTAAVPITNEYTGITHCVAIYTAVAARIGGSRVTLQPSFGAEPDPESMQLRVNGKLVRLTDAGIVLTSSGGEDASPAAGATGVIDGHVKRLANGVVEITDSRGTQIVITPQYWTSQKVWYLNLNVYQTSAYRGTMGLIPEGSWLPALPDGGSLGSRPESSTERYETLYEKFADAWRVTDGTSLFDYESGTNTATFTLDEWPRNEPKSCDLAGKTSVQPATEAVAQQACANVADAVQKADCVFDVMVTGHTGFAQGYEVMQRVKPRGPGWYTPNADEPRPDGTPPPDHASMNESWWWWPLVAIAILLLVFIIRKFTKKSAAP